MIRGCLTGIYENDVAGAVGTLTLDGGDVKLQASITDATLATGPSLNGLSLSVIKPASFVIDYNLPKKDVKFQFMNSVRVMERPLHMTYTHWKNENRTALDGTLMIDQAHKVSANYVLDSGNCKLRYSYNPDGLTTVEPSYDFGSNAWDLSVTRMVHANDVVSASYQSSSKVLGFDWRRITSSNGSFKVSATMNLDEPSKIPTLTAESTLNF
ncbi:OLC1v1010813C1 [Oldenlandia corymbosa var. corymbosa]|uniref:OLC1v1010813C1 n=1 Tax=Oldenlandia corymbosa var. corymbosa TaxID=529605 RepID=A0AAV1DSD3_OLDCO|nr:OLC1v1010813C1 [Oldenlandia corymbosa var. corymbosa]